MAVGDNRSMARGSKWPHEAMWIRAAQLRRGGLSYSGIQGRLPIEFELEEVPSQDTIRRQIQKNWGSNEGNSIPVEGVLRVGDPVVGWWDHLGRSNSARFVTIEVMAVAALQQMCHASISLEDPSGPAFPLHWAGEPYSINETQPEFLTIHPDVPGRLDVAFMPKPHGSSTAAKGAESRSIPAKGKASDGMAGVADWDGTGCWIAQPLALSNPMPGMRAYLTPRQYRVRLRIHARSNVLVFDDTFVLDSPERPEDLLIRRFTATTPRE